MDEPLNRLGEHAAELNKESDELRVRLEAFENAINRMGLGVEAVGDNGLYGYGRIREKTWGFYRLKSGLRIPIIGCSRAERMEFAAVAGALVDTLLRESDNELGRARQANRDIESQLKRVRG